MSIYSYLRNVEKGLPVYADEITIKQRLCVWALRNIFPARYWKDVYVEGCRVAQERAAKEIAGYSKKLTYVLRLYAAHIGEPAYSMTWQQAGTEELQLGDVPQPELPALDMSDDEFTLMMCQGEPDRETKH